jgi:anti-sigma factor RsiW
MRKGDIHTSDQDLLRAADGELPGREASLIQAHLAACWKCRARRAELDRAIPDFIAAHHRDKADD